jgi:hypothetical protein
MRHPKMDVDYPRRERAPSIYDHGYSAGREDAMSDFKSRWST